MDECTLGTKTSWITIFINTALCAFKIIAGIIGQSTAMLADGVHTLSDILATFVVIIGLNISSKKEDEKHPYGHEKFEAECAKIVSTILLLTGLLIGYEGIKSLILGDIKTPGFIALLAAMISIVVKEGMYWYTIIVAKKIRSLSMEADAWHHRSDAFSSIGTFAGIFGARLGIKVLDPIAGIIVSFFIIKVGIDFYRKSTAQLIDSSADKDTIEKIRNVVMSTIGVKDITMLKTRLFGNKIYVDIEICVDSNMSVKQGHEIAEAVHLNVENNVEHIKHCMVHLEPYNE
ncbi:cation transporter [Caloramator sp. E03]|uniref:cation diffusion facilitator family transporter n=1 Tax=Caloramator sp. E03 TaxID=2576307 RepID=UPI0011109F2A|nr:cation diffusion facilitator family transporter [Caloramator sp. E03]QCX34730.1 cation transporter [Caloramator sp. E03]